MAPLAIILVAALVITLKSFVIIMEYERGIVYRLGRVAGIKERGLRWLIPFIDSVIKVDQRTMVFDIPTQDVITKDNVSIKVNAVLNFRVVDPMKALLSVQDYLYATEQLAQTTLRSVCGEVELDDLLAHREKINLRIQEIIDHLTDPWGVKVVSVALKHIDLPPDMQRAMARQAEAERERRAKVIKAEGEFEASEKLTSAAKVMSESPATLQLRYLETLRDIAAEHNSTILFPIPIDFFEAFKKRLTGNG